MKTFGELVEFVTFEAPAAVGAFLRARFVATPEQIEATMERIGADFGWRLCGRHFDEWDAEICSKVMSECFPYIRWLEACDAHEKRMRAMG